MAIDSVSANTIGLNPNLVNENRQTKNSGNNTANSASGHNLADTVNITGAATQLQALEKSISSLPVVDIQRVDAVKREISNGTFVIDPVKIASQMIQFESQVNKGLI